MTGRFVGLVLGAGLAGALALHPGLAAAQTIIDSTSPPAIMAVLDDMGYAPQMGVDSYGDPLITGTISNSNYAVVFYDCTGKGRCGILLFTHAWEINGITVEKMNEWNNTQLWGQAYVDEDSHPVLTISVNLVGGLTDENFRDMVGKWAETVVSFEDFIGWTGASVGKGGR